MSRLKGVNGWGLSLGVALLPMLIATSVYAEEVVSSHMDVYQVIQKQGVETFQPASNVRPNETLEYRISYVNHGTAPVKNLVVNGPVPAGTVFVASSARSDAPADIRYSLDHGHVWQEAPLKKRVVAANGSATEVVVPPEQYTDVEWIAKELLRPGKAQVYTYRVKVRP